MRQPIALRPDYDAVLLRGIARESEDPGQVRRLMTLAMIYDGASRTAAAKAGCVTLQVVRDWVLRFNADGPAGLIDRKAPGQPSRLNDEHRAALAVMVENGPIPRYTAWSVGESSISASGCGKNIRSLWQSRR